MYRILSLLWPPGIPDRKTETEAFMPAEELQLLCGKGSSWADGFSEEVAGLCKDDWLIEKGGSKG